MEVTAFISPYGLYEFTRTSFGLLNAGARYNRVARDAEEQAGQGCRFYVDDTFAASKNFEDHLQLLRRIFRSYRSHGLLISPKKTKLFRRAVDFLSVKVSEDGLFPTDEGTEKVMAWPRPVKPKDVAAFTGFVQYYAHFLPDFSELCAPLNKVKSKKKLIWTEEMEDSFNKIKEAFREVSGRRHLVLDKETMTYPGLILQVDFSKNAVAAVLHQQTEQGERFIAARTKTLKPYEKSTAARRGSCWPWCMDWTSLRTSWRVRGSLWCLITWVSPT